jgi:hypothetical protein
MATFDKQQEQSRREVEPMYWYNKASDLRAAAGATSYCFNKKRKANVATELRLVTDLTWRSLLGPYILCSAAFLENFCTKQLR